MTMGSRWLLASALLALAGPAAAQSGDWTTYGGNDWNQRYSQLKTINTSNVGQLVPRMIFQTGIERLGSFENTPIVQNGVMYVTTPYNTAMAYDLNTKKELWRYNHKLGTTIYCCGPNNRGVGIHGGAHVYMGTLDSRLVSLDAQPMMGGALATAGGLTFTGEGNGNFNAYDSKSGKLLWQFNGGAGRNSAPMTFVHGGEQFIAVACGGNFQLSFPLGDAILVFGRPKRK